MKREILCPACRVGAYATVIKPEVVKFVFGTLRKGCSCDCCGNKLGTFRTAWAVSVCRQEAEYKPWEREFLK